MGRRQHGMWQVSDKMPESMDEEAVAAWTRSTWDRASGSYVSSLHADRALARAVLALVEAKVRDGVRETIRVLDEIDLCDEDERTIVARVMNKEAPRV